MYILGFRILEFYGKCLKNFDNSSCLLLTICFLLFGGHFFAHRIKSAGSPGLEGGGFAASEDLCSTGKNKQVNYTDKIIFIVFFLFFSYNISDYSLPTHYWQQVGNQTEKRSPSPQTLRYSKGFFGQWPKNNHWKIKNTAKNSNTSSQINK